MGEIVFFILAFLILWFGIVFIKSDEALISIFPTVLIGFITELCIGAVVAKLYSFFSVYIGLKSMGMAYLLIGAIIWGYSAWKREIQKFSVNKWDIYSFGLITAWFIIMFLIIFTPSLLNRYVNSDAAGHLLLATWVMDNGTISHMHFAELFNGLVLSMFSHFITRLSLYKAFILADAFSNLVNVFMFYALAAIFVKHKFIKIILPLLSGCYFLGWPLFCFWLGGFGYQGWGVTLFLYIIYLFIRLYECEKGKKQILLVAELGVGGLSLAFCYMYFLPILLIAAFIYCFFIVKKNGIIISGKTLFLIGIFLTGISLAFICYFGYFHGDISFVLSALGRGGWNHKELYQDFVLLLPPTLYMGWRCIKNRKVNFIFISTAATMAFIGVTFILCLCNILSAYYVYKSYYLWWALVWLMCISAADYFMYKDRAIVFAYGMAIILPIFMTISGIDNKLEEMKITVDDANSRYHPSVFPVMDSYRYFLNDTNNYLADREALCEVCKYIADVMPSDERMPLIGCDGRWPVWYYTFTQKEGIYVADGDELLNAISQYIQDGCKYIVIHQNAQAFWDVRDKLDFLDIVYTNGYYGIYVPSS